MSESSKKQPIYFISGLGATNTVFEKTNVPEDYEMHFIDWVEPIHEGESLDEYIDRLASQVKHEDPIFAGLSFGGIMAMELTKKFKSSKVIMLSSFRDKKDLTFPIRSLLALKTYKLIPNVELEQVRRIVRTAYARSSKVPKQKLIEMMGDQSPQFLRWSVKQIDDYKFDLDPDVKIYSIVGKKDRLVRVWEGHDISVVQDGTHIAVFANHEDVNKFIARSLESNE